VGKEYRPGVTDPVMKADGALTGGLFKIGRDIAQFDTHNVIS
jgi:DNA-directed RNA polymerase subunit H (RpoH/RPB5)